LEARLIVVGRKATINQSATHQHHCAQLPWAKQPHHVIVIINTRGFFQQRKMMKKYAAKNGPP